MTASRRTAIALALCLAGLAAGRGFAQFALPLGSAGTANPVMAGKDWEAAVAAIGLDGAQRQVADAIFDEAQERMFDAKRRADGDPGNGTAAPPGTRDAAAEEAARRALARDILAEVDGLFGTVARLVGEERSAVAEREGQAARRRAIRAMLGPAASAGPVQWDVERAIERCKAPQAEKEAAYAGLAAYRQRIGTRLQRLLEDEIARQRRSARAEGERGASAGDDSVARGFARMMEAQAAAREARQELAEDHLGALAAVAAALSPDAVREVQDAALGRIWPRTAMDPDSPAKVIDQLLAKRTAAQDRAPIERIRDAWRTRWWAATVRMAGAEHAMPGFLAGARKAPTEAERRARESFDEARADRRSADRDAWRALAAADPERRGFHEERANAERRDGEFGTAPSLPGEAGPAGVTVGTTVVSSTSGESRPDAVIETNAVVSSVAVVVTGSDDAGGAGEPGNVGVAADTMVFTADSTDLEGGLGLIMAGGDGEPIVFGDGFGDGMGSDSAFAGIEVDMAGVGDAAATGGMPGRMPRERLGQVARALGADPDAPAVAALLDDYDAAADAVRATVPGIRGARPGGTERFPAAGTDEVAGILAKAMPALAAADDRVIADLGALGGADAAAVAAAQAERAAQRLWSARHGITPLGSAEPTVAGKVFLGGCLGAPGIPEEELAGARAAWSAWAPSIRAAAERAFAADRETAPELCRIVAGWRERFSGVDAGNAAERALEIDEADTALQRDLVERIGAASADITRAALAGRRAVLERLGPAGQAAFGTAWLRAAAPQVYEDRKDAMRALDAARGMQSLSDAQRTNVDSLRGAHAARHGELSDRLATLFVASRGGAADLGIRERPADIGRRTADLRFERAELNARSLRRLRALLDATQAAAIPALSPATTRPAPGRASP
jgi:hypothetical protein